MFRRDREMDIHAILAQNLRAHRRKKGWSQERLAFECGLHRTYVSGVERGVRNPTVSVLAKMAGVLDSSPSALLAELNAPT